MYSTSAGNRKSSRESTVSVLTKKRLPQPISKRGTSFSQYSSAPAIASMAACSAGGDSSVLEKSMAFMNEKYCQRSPIKREQLWFLHDAPAAQDFGLRPSMTALRAMTPSPRSFHHRNKPQRLPVGREQLSKQES